MGTRKYDSKDHPEFVTKDSGERESHDTGAVRDVRKGKGRYDLISPFALHRLAQLLERGAIKYEERNWEKGFAYSRCVDSAKRHLNEYVMGLKDEDHLAGVLFNVMAIMHFEQTHPELNDMPEYSKAPVLLLGSARRAAEPKPTIIKETFGDVGIGHSYKYPNKDRLEAIKEAMPEDNKKLSKDLWQDAPECTKEDLRDLYRSDFENHEYDDKLSKNLLF